MLTPPETDLAGRRILVVEDERLLALDIGSILANWGYEVVGPAASVATALALIKVSLPDCAVLDVHLRGETSAPVAVALRDRGRPFVVLTAYKRVHLPPALLDAPLLSKPVDEAMLGRELAALLSDQTPR